MKAICVFKTTIYYGINMENQNSLISYISHGNQLCDIWYYFRLIQHMISYPVDEECVVFRGLEDLKLLLLLAPSLNFRV